MSSAGILRLAISATSLRFLIRFTPKPSFRLSILNILFHKASTMLYLPCWYTIFQHDRLITTTHTYIIITYIGSEQYVFFCCFTFRRTAATAIAKVNIVCNSNVSYIFYYNFIFLLVIFPTFSFGDLTRVVCVEHP